jgi:2-haloalkanoic acid dehalogenase type II
MSRRYDVVTFDCYGTLIDWERGIWESIQAAAQSVGAHPERDAVLAAYAEIEPEIEAERFRSYRDVLTVCVERLAERFGWKLPRARHHFLAESLPFWPPFPDTGPALSRLAAAGHGLGILSNCDEDLLAATRQHFPVSFDLIVTAERVRSYKPEHGHFLEARRRIGNARWLHAAQSHFHDVVPCRELSIPSAWVNRKGETAAGGILPDREVPDLAGLADWLAPQEK